MSTVKIEFTRNTEPAREGGPGYKQGDVVEVSHASANHWFARGAAVPKKETASALKPAQREQVVEEMGAQIAAIAEAQPGPVDSPESDGGRAGVGAEPDAGAGGSRPTLRASGNRSK